MKEKIQVFIADAAGNRTIFVLTPIRRERYGAVSAKLLGNTLLKGEQVAFILPPQEGSLRKMEMGGMEFCGNASRSFGLYLAMEQGIIGFCTVEAEVSGISSPIQVSVDTQLSSAGLEMPLPLIIGYVDYKGLSLPIVIFEGILHIIANSLPPKISIFEEIKEAVLKKYDPPALGVLFFNEGKQFMTPVVWVQEIDSTFFEGSCGSGSVALACFLMRNEESGQHRFTIHQPKGDLITLITKDKGHIKRLFLDGKVEFSKAMEVEL